MQPKRILILILLSCALVAHIDAASYSASFTLAASASTEYGFGPETESSTCVSADSSLTFSTTSTASSGYTVVIEKRASTESVWINFVSITINGAGTETHLDGYTDWECWRATITNISGSQSITVDTYTKIEEWSMATGAIVALACIGVFCLPCMAAFVIGCFLLLIASILFLVAVVVLALILPWVTLIYGVLACMGRGRRRRVNPNLTPSVPQGPSPEVAMFMQQQQLQQQQVMAQQKYIQELEMARSYSSQDQLAGIVMVGEIPAFPNPMGEIPAFPKAPSAAQLPAFPKLGLDDDEEDANGQGRPETAKSVQKYS